MDITIGMVAAATNAHQLQASGDRRHNRPVDEESKRLVTINTQKGLFQYTRLPCGISSAPGMFQRLMESLLQEILDVVVYRDDILVAGKTKAEHLKRLDLKFWSDCRRQGCD